SAMDSGSVDRAAAYIAREQPSAPSTTEPSNSRPRTSLTLRNQNALRCASGSPRNWSRTSGTSSVSLQIFSSTICNSPRRDSSPTYSRRSKYGISIFPHQRNHPERTDHAAGYQELQPGSEAARSRHQTPNDQGRKRADDIGDAGVK